MVGFSGRWLLVLGLGVMVVAHVLVLRWLDAMLPDRLLLVDSDSGCCGESGGDSSLMQCDDLLFFSSPLWYAWVLLCSWNDLTVPVAFFDASVVFAGVDMEGWGCCCWCWLPWLLRCQILFAAWLQRDESPPLVLELDVDVVVVGGERARNDVHLSLFHREEDVVVDGAFSCSSSSCSNIESDFWMLKKSSTKNDSVIMVCLQNKMLRNCSSSSARWACNCLLAGNRFNLLLILGGKREPARCLVVLNLSCSFCESCVKSSYLLAIRKGRFLWGSTLIMYQIFWSLRFSKETMDAESIV